MQVQCMAGFKILVEVHLHVHIRLLMKAASLMTPSSAMMTWAEPFAPGRCSIGSPFWSVYLLFLHVLASCQILSPRSGGKRLWKKSILPPVSS